MNKKVTVIKSHADDVSDPDRTIKWNKGDYVYGQVTFDVSTVVVESDDGDTWYFNNKHVIVE